MTDDFFSDGPYTRTAALDNGQLEARFDRLPLGLDDEFLLVVRSVNRGPATDETPLTVTARDLQLAAKCGAEVPVVGGSITARDGEIRAKWTEDGQLLSETAVTAAPHKLHDVAVAAQQEGMPKP